MFNDPWRREIAIVLAEEAGEDFESLRFERQIHWYCRADSTLTALEAGGYEVRKIEGKGGSDAGEESKEDS